MDIDPNNLPMRAIAKFTIRPEESNYLAILENKDKKLVQQNKKETKLIKK